MIGRFRFLVDPGLALLSGLTAVGIAVWSMGIRWRDIPIVWGEGDMLTVYALAKSMSRGHWYLVNPDLGYPAFQDLGHYPVPDVVSVAQIGMLAQLSDSPMGAVNVFALGTFFTVAVAFYAAARLERVSRAPSFVLAVAFAVLPWHFVRAVGHAFLASYVSVPLAIMLISVVARRRLDRPSSGLMALAMWGAAVVVGLNGVYYALLTSVLLGVTLVLGFASSGLRLPGWRTLLVVALVPLATAGAIAVNRMSVSTPSVGESVVRDPAEAYLYGGNIATLFFPAVRTASGEWLGRHLDLTFPNDGTFEGEALLSAAGLVAVLITCWMAAYRWTSLARPGRGTATARASFWPGMFILTVAFFAAGGFGALFSYWVSSDIRAWGRFSIFAVGIAFLVAGLVLTALISSPRRAVRISAWALIGAMGLSAVWDIAPGRFVLDLDQYRGRDRELREYVSAVEGRTDPGCPVLEMPLVEFPEVPPINGMADYSHFWSYLYSSDLRWSYGAVKGTPQGAWGLAVKDDPAALRTEALAAGFCGMQFDTSALANPAELVDELIAFGLPDVVSSSGRWLYFDLTGLEEDEYVVSAGAGFIPAAPVGPVEAAQWWMVDQEAQISIHGVPDTTPEVTLGLVAPTCGPARFGIDGTEVVVRGATTLTRSVSLDGSGTASVTIEARSEPCAMDGIDRPAFVGLQGAALEGAAP